MATWEKYFKEEQDKERKDRENPELRTVERFQEGNIPTPEYNPPEERERRYRGEEETGGAQTVGGPPITPSFAGPGNEPETRDRPMSAVDAAMADFGQGGWQPKPGWYSGDQASFTNSLIHGNFAPDPYLYPAESRAWIKVHEAQGGGPLKMENDWYINPAGEKSLYRPGRVPTESAYAANADFKPTEYAGGSTGAYGYYPNAPKSTATAIEAEGTRGGYVPSYINQPQYQGQTAPAPNIAPTGGAAPTQTPRLQIPQGQEPRTFIQQKIGEWIMSPKNPHRGTALPDEIAAIYAAYGLPPPPQ